MNIFRPRCVDTGPFPHTNNPYISPLSRTPRNRPPHFPLPEPKTTTHALFPVNFPTNPFSFQREIRPRASTRFSHHATEPNHPPTASRREISSLQPNRPRLDRTPPPPPTGTPLPARPRTFPLTHRHSLWLSRESVDRLSLQMATIYYLILTK